MAMKKVQDLDFTGDAIKFEKPGQKITGHYVGNRSVNTGLGMSKLHVFATAKGNVGAWGSAQLDSKLASIPAGSFTEVVFTSKIKHKKGFLKKFDVAFDDDNVIDVGMPQVNTDPGAEPDYDSAAGEPDMDDLPDSYDPQGDEQAELEAEPEQAPPQQRQAPRATPPAARPPQAASASRQATVANLLNKKRA